MPPSNNNASLNLNKREKGCFALLFSLIVITVVCGLLSPVGHPSQGPASKAMFQARTIGLALTSYSIDNGHYPDGKSSTEVFQKLMDGGYVSDPALFYLPMPGKVRATSDTKILKPENVCWDVTRVDVSSSDQAPLVFLTGYKVTYKAGASVVPLKEKTSTLGDAARSWSDRWYGVDYPTGYMAVCYKGNNARAIQASADGTIPNFIPADFDPKGKVYHQLTPEGELAP